jgi:hypothetical protein
MRKSMTKTWSGPGTCHENTGADPENGADHGDLKKEEKHATNRLKMTTSTTQTRKEDYYGKMDKKAGPFLLR